MLGPRREAPVRKGAMRSPTQNAGKEKDTSLRGKGTGTRDTPERRPHPSPATGEAAWECSSLGCTQQCVAYTMSIS